MMETANLFQQQQQQAMLHGQKRASWTAGFNGSSPSGNQVLAASFAIPSAAILPQTAANSYRQQFHSQLPSAQLAHHRRQSSLSSTQSAISHSPARSSPTLTDPPSLILSKPGEAYPITSSSASSPISARALGGGDPPPSPPHSNSSPTKSAPILQLKRAHARRISVDTRTRTASFIDDEPLSSTSSTSPATASSEGVVAPWLANLASSQPSPPASPTEDMTPLGNGTGGPRRPSQAASLRAALSGRQRQRPASIGAPPSGLVPIDVAAASKPVMRAVSDSYPSTLSPFATTFSPLPISPFSPGYTPTVVATPSFSTTQFGGGNHLQSQQQQQQRSSAAPIPAYGTATPIRQPKGPAVEAELGSSNFALRLRKSAIERLSVGRLSLGGV
ncbi:hypothetical protein T439DRAFT_186242 [Meredithblackwellia eburnea MCA 4105]